MTEERITDVETPQGNTHTTHTVVTDGEARRGGSGWLIALLLIIALVAAFLIFSNMSGSEVAKDNAVADAAGEVGAAAEQVGDAAQDAADEVTNN
jgi:hypothetical protein